MRFLSDTGWSPVSVPGRTTKLSARFSASPLEKFLPMDTAKSEV